MKLLIILVLAGILAYLGATVPLGRPRPGAPSGRTFFQHIQAIWKSDDVVDLKNGIEEKAGPAADRLKEKVHDMTASDPTPDAPTPDAPPAPHVPASAH